MPAPSLPEPGEQPVDYVCEAETGELSQHCGKRKQKLYYSDLAGGEDFWRKQYYVDKPEEGTKVGPCSPAYRLLLNYAHITMLIRQMYNNILI